MSSHHRSGVWVQKNKNHKHGQHKSKGSIQTQQKGRVVKPTGRKGRKDAALNKIVRKNQKLQKKNAQIFHNLQEKQKIESAPLDILIIPFSEQISSQKFLDILRATQDEGDIKMEENPNAYTRLRFPRLKLDSNFRVADLGDLFGTLDLARVLRPVP